MSRPSQADVTRWLRACGEGHAGALDQLLPLVYGELRRLANTYLQGERGGHTLQPTALVHEAYLRLCGADVEWRDRVQFFKAAAQSMRRILVDSARAHRAAKRGGGERPRTLDEAIALPDEPSMDLLALDEALSDLAAQDERKSEVVELHFFGGLTFAEIARALGVSVATVTRDMTLARAWLRSAMSGGSDGA